MMLKKASGFTLIESVLVLFVISAMVILPSISLKQAEVKKNETEFINNFKLLWKKASKDYRIFDDKVTVSLDKYKKVISFTYKKETAFSRNLVVPASLMIVNNHQYIFNTKNKNPLGGTFHFRTEDGKYEIKLVHQANFQLLKVEIKRLHTD